MEPPRRVELLTYSLRVNCSTTELRRLGITGYYDVIEDEQAFFYRRGKRG